jgi:probable phosphoglycerate mutase
MLLALAASLLGLLQPNSLADLPPIPAGTMRVFVVRHGQSVHNLQPPPDLPQDQLDRLTPLGLEQARAAGLALRSLGISLIVCSPMRRTRETAEEIRAVMGDVEIRVDERLRPLEMGTNGDGAPLEWNDRWAEWEFGRDPVPNGGESLGQLGMRVFQVILALKDAYADRSVVFVSHSEVISNLTGFLEGTTLTGRFAARIKNGSLTAVDSPPAAFPRLLMSNFVPVMAAPVPAPAVHDARAARPPPHRRAAP